MFSNSKQSHLVIWVAFLMNYKELTRFAKSVTNIGPLAEMLVVFFKNYFLKISNKLQN